MKPDEIRNCDPERAYRINFCDYSFLSGHVPSGEQVLMGALDWETVVALFFSPEGRYLRFEFFPVPFTPDPKLLPGQQKLQRAYALQDGQRKFMGEIRMTPGTIHIRHFAFPEWKIGIAEWPLADFPDVQRALAAGEEPEDEFLAEWKEQKRWVLIWKKELWMTADGEIGDS